MKKQNFTDYETLDEILQELGIPDTLNFQAIVKPEKQKYLSAVFVISEVAEFANKGVSFDYRSGNDQPKWFVWPDVEANDEFPSGIGLSDPGATSLHEYSFVGSWLCFLRREDALHFFKIAPEQYKTFHIKPSNS